MATLQDSNYEHMCHHARKYGNKNTYNLLFKTVNNKHLTAWNKNFPNTNNEYPDVSQITTLYIYINTWTVYYLLICNVRFSNQRPCIYNIDLSIYVYK
jgi:hypothetical protein